MVELAIACLAKVRFGPRDALLQTGFHGIGRMLGIEPKPVRKVTFELSQDVGRDVHASGGATDSYADAGEVAGSELVGNGAQTVMGVQSASELHTDQACSEIDLVMHHKDLDGQDVMGAREL